MLLSAGNMCSTLLLFQHPVFALSSLEVVGFLFCYVFLYLLVMNLPQLQMHRVIFSPLELLCIVSLKKPLVQV